MNKEWAHIPGVEQIKRKTKHEFPSLDCWHTCWLSIKQLKWWLYTHSCGCQLADLAQAVTPWKCIHHEHDGYNNNDKHVALSSIDRVKCIIQTHSGLHSLVCAIWWCRWLWGVTSKFWASYAVCIFQIGMSFAERIFNSSLSFASNWNISSLVQLSSYVFSADCEFHCEVSFLSNAKYALHCKL